MMISFSSQSTPAYVLNPKQDLYGLGYDPFKYAPEFKERNLWHESRNNQVVKRGVLMKGNHLSPNSGNYAPDFGIGALEDLDVEYGDIYDSSFGLLMREAGEDQPSRIFISEKQSLENTKKRVPGFKVASGSDYKDDNSRLLIDGFANLVARCGKLFEDLSKEKNRSNSLSSFLNGGSGYDYYARKLLAN